MKWQQTYRGYKYDKLISNPNIKQLVNHFEFHKEISTKNGLIRSLGSFCSVKFIVVYFNVEKENKLYLSEITPITFSFNMDDEVNFDNDMQRFAQFFINNFSNPNFYPKCEHNDKKNGNVWYNFDYRRRGKYQTHNLPQESSSSPFLEQKMKETFIRGFNVWVIKPTGLNRGRGIEVFHTLESLNEIMNQYFSRVPNITKKNEEESGDEDSDESEEDTKNKRGSRSHGFS